MGATQQEIWEKAIASGKQITASFEFEHVMGQVVSTYCTALHYCTALCYALCCSLLPAGLCCAVRPHSALSAAVCLLYCLASTAWFLLLLL